MPESPEVTALAEFVARRAVGRTVVSFDVVLPKALKAGEARAVLGARVVAAGRRGKLLDLALTDSSGDDLRLIVHWGHDGWLLWHDAVPEGRGRVGDATLIARLAFDDGSGFDLTDAGPWKALSIFVVAEAADVPTLAKLGPEPTDDAFTPEVLARIVHGRRKQLKALLQDQSAIAGIGNAYSDEILHAARLSPVVHASTLDDAEIDRLHTAVRRILVSATEDRRGLPPEALTDDKRARMRVHRRPGEACPVCGDTIAETVFSGAAAHYCPTCQTGGARLA